MCQFKAEMYLTFKGIWGGGGTSTLNLQTSPSDKGRGLNHLPQQQLSESEMKGGLQIFHIHTLEDLKVFSIQSSEIIDLLESPPPQKRKPVINKVPS